MANIVSLKGFKTNVLQDISLAMMGVQTGMKKLNEGDLKSAINCFKYSYDLMAKLNDDIPEESKDKFLEKVNNF